MTRLERLSRTRASARWICSLGLRVQVGGGLVQNHHCRVLQKQPGDGEPLLLAPGKAVAPLPHHGVQAVGQALDQVVDLGRLCAPR